MNGGASSRRRSARVSLDTMDMLNLEYTMPGSRAPELERSPTTMGVALMVPATFAMNPTSGLIMLGAIYAGAIYGGANSSILICTPGTPSSVATTFDGWPLCQKGRADLGLYTSLLSSAFAARWRGSRSSSAGRKVFGCVSSGSPPSR